MSSSLGSVVVSNEELATRLSYTPGEIEKKTGIQNRFQLDRAKENVYVLMAVAVKRAANSAGVSMSDIKGIFVATNPFGLYCFPNPSTILSYLLGIDNCYNWVGGSGCCAGLQTLESASYKLMYGEDDQNAVYAVVSANQTSAIVEPGTNDEMIFSDSAACLIIAKGTKYNAYYSLEFVDGTNTYQGAKALTLLHGDTVLKHNGKAIFKFAAQSHNTILRLLQINKFPQSASTFIGLEDVTRHKLYSNCDEIVLVGFGEGLSIFVCKLTIDKSGKQLRLPNELSSLEIRHKYWQRYHAEY